MSQPYWTSWRYMLREAYFEGYISNVSPLRVGAGREGGLGTIDLSVLRIDYSGLKIPYIPGSSLKGVFRSYSESLALLKGFRVCSGLSKSTCMDQFQKDMGVTLSKYIERLLKNNMSTKAVEEFWKRACLMCKVFGSPSYSGRVSFSDAYPLDEKNSLLPFKLGVRKGTAIDRRTGSVQSRALYDVEYVEPGARFRFTLRCINLPNYVLGMLSKVLEDMNAGRVKIGGFKTRGFGMVKILDPKFRCRDYGVKTNHVLRSFKEFRDEIDSEVDLTGISTVKDGWVICESENAWRALARLREAWDHAGQA